MDRTLEYSGVNLGLLAPCSSKCNECALRFVCLTSKWGSLAVEDKEAFLDACADDFRATLTDVQSTSAFFLLIECTRMSNGDTKYMTTKVYA